MIAQHGLGSERSQELLVVANTLCAAGFAVASIDAIQHGDRLDLTSIAPATYALLDPVLRELGFEIARSPEDVRPNYVASTLDGPDGFLAALEKRLAAKRHALVAVAEGAGQHLFENEPSSRDASGNVRPHDIGLLLKERIAAHFQAKSTPVNVRYIDPSYLIRGVPANTYDRLLCDSLAQIRRRTDVKPLIGFRVQNVNVEHAGFWLHATESAA